MGRQRSKLLPRTISYSTTLRSKPNSAPTCPACAAGIHAYYYDSGDVKPEHLVQHLVGTVLKDNPDDLKKVQHYFEHVVKKRASALWNRFYDARAELG